MGIVNKLLLAIAFLLILNYYTGGFIYKQISGSGVGQLQEPATCAVGVYMASPFWNGLPIIPAADDITVGIAIGLFYLLLLRWLKKPVTPRQKILVVISGWLTYKLIGMMLIWSTPGCSAYMDMYDNVLGPAMPIFLILAVFALYKIWKWSRNA